VTARLAAFQQRPRHHQFSLGQISLYISLVLSAAASLRGASRVLEIWGEWLELPEAAPSWYSGRLWLLRVGYYKLTTPKQQAPDWVWVVDQTVQMGTEKCLVILGIRLSALPPPGRCLRHKDVEPIALYPVKQSNGEVVYQQLTQAVTQTGVPREILSDAGPDLKAGVEQFRQAHPETCAIYDIKHQTALVLKHELEKDPMWPVFTQRATQTKQRVQQTPLAFLAPPTQRRKARYMNVDILLRWGSHLLGYMERGPRAGHADGPPERLEEQYGWIRDFRGPLQGWGELLQVVEVVEQFVRTQGLYRGCHQALEQRLAPLAPTERGRQVSQQLLAFVRAESAKAASQERLLGSSEVIESVFGKQKRIEHHQANSGFTGLLLTLSAMVAETTQEVIHHALETVSTKRVLQWCQQYLGPSLQAQRQQAFRQLKQAEQKRFQFQQAA
jgi:hypothetical protein